MICKIQLIIFDMVLIRILTQETYNINTPIPPHRTFTKNSTPLHICAEIGLVFIYGTLYHNRLKL